MNSKSYIGDLFNDRYCTAQIRQRHIVESDQTLASKSCDEDGRWPRRRAGVANSKRHVEVGTGRKFQD